MAYSSIVKPSVYFNTKLISGNGGTQSLTGVGFKPDFTWIKSRSRVDPHSLTDIVRGVASQLDSSLTSAPTTHSDAITSFNSDGFSLGSQADVNRSGTTFASWNWLAGGSQGSSNTDGSINTTYTSVNTTAGFSICKWTGNATNSTIGHGLGAVPKVVIIKNLSNGSAQWVVYHVSTGNTQACYLNTNSAPTDVIGFFNDTTPTSSVFTVGTDTAVNGSGNEMIAYCFAEKTGYSKFGSYVGNGNADAPFVYTGFKPAFVMFKKSSASGHWMMNDNKRSASGGFNVLGERLKANETDAGATAVYVDFLSNGFKLRTTSSSWNENNETFIFMAFAEEPLVANSGTNGVPATAR